MVGYNPTLLVAVLGGVLISAGISMTILSFRNGRHSSSLPPKGGGRGPWGPPPPSEEMARNISSILFVGAKGVITIGPLEPDGLFSGRTRDDEGRPVHFKAERRPHQQLQVGQHVKLISFNQTNGTYRVAVTDTAFDGSPVNPPKPVEQQLREEIKHLREAHARELAEAKFQALRQLALDIVSAMDPFYPPSRLAPKPAELSPDAQVLLKGIMLVDREITRALAKNGINQMQVGAGKFNPNLHEVVKAISTDSKPVGWILGIARRGYTIHRRLLRAASVVTARPSIAKLAKGDVDADA